MTEAMTADETPSPEDVTPDDPRVENTEEAEVADTDEAPAVAAALVAETEEAAEVPGEADVAETEEDPVKLFLTQSKVRVIGVPWSMTSKSVARIPKRE